MAPTCWEKAQLLAARGVAVLFECDPSTCNPPISIETVLASAMEHCHTCRDRDGGGTPDEVRLLSAAAIAFLAAASTERSCALSASKLINEASIALTRAGLYRLHKP